MLRCAKININFIILKKIRAFRDFHLLRFVFSLTLRYLCPYYI